MIGLLDLLDGVIGLSNEFEFASRLEMHAKLGSWTVDFNELVGKSDQWERTLTIIILNPYMLTMTILPVAPSLLNVDAP